MLMWATIWVSICLAELLAVTRLCRFVGLRKMLLLWLRPVRFRWSQPLIELRLVAVSAYFGVRGHETFRKSNSARVSCDQRRAGSTFSNARSSRARYKSSYRVVRCRGGHGNS